MIELSRMIELSDPLARPLHFLMLELVVLAATALVFGHALSRYRAGDRRHMFQWLVITSYGVQMELIAFNFLHNYEHATFTVQLYHGQLPLYVTGLYGSFMYSGIKLAERLGVHPFAEAFLAGFAICLIDVPFDISGVAVGWWRWLDTDPVLAFRWLGVPVTSYYWYLIFGAVAAAQCRLLWPRLERRSFALAALVALVAGFGVIVFGVLGFLPFHGLAALGVSHGTIVAAHLAGCAILALVVRGRPSEPSRMITAAVLLLVGSHVALLAFGAIAGTLPDAAERVGYSVAALAGLAALLFALPLRRVAAREPEPELRASVR
jgi:hypothetical protein